MVMYMHTYGVRAVDVVVVKRVRPCIVVFCAVVVVDVVGVVAVAT